MGLTNAAFIAVLLVPSTDPIPTASTLVPCFDEWVGDETEPWCVGNSLGSPDGYEVAFAGDIPVVCQRPPSGFREPDDCWIASDSDIETVVASIDESTASADFHCFVTVARCADAADFAGLSAGSPPYVLTSDSRHLEAAVRAAQEHATEVAAQSRGLDADEDEPEIDRSTVVLIDWLLDDEGLHLGLALVNHEVRASGNESTIYCAQWTFDPAFAIVTEDALTPVSAEPGWVALDTIATDQLEAC